MSHRAPRPPGCPAHSSPNVEMEPISRGTGSSNPSPSSGESCRTSAGCQESGAQLYGPARSGSDAIYSMTRSARCSSEFGIWMPICSAAFRLITSSNRLGSSTGRVAGHHFLASTGKHGILAISYKIPRINSLFWISQQDPPHRGVTIEQPSSGIPGACQTNIEL